MYTELYHHGVKGQKWGVITWIKRRKAQRKQRREEENMVKKEINERKNEAKKKPHELSDAELDARIKRLQKERELLDLETRISQLSPKKVSRGRKILDEIIAPTAKDVSKTLLKEGTLKMGRKYLGLSEGNAKSAYDELKKEVDTLELKKKKAVVQDYFEKREKERRERGDNDVTHSDIIDNRFEEYGEIRLKGSEFINQYFLEDGSKND